MVKRRKGPPARPSAARHDADKAGVISEALPAEAIVAEQTGSGPEDLPDAHATPEHVPSVHETLLETVSPEAMEAGTGEPLSAHADAPSEAPEPEEAPAEPAHAASDEAHAPEAAVAEESSDDGRTAVTEPPGSEAGATDAAPLADIAPPAPLDAAVAPEAAATVEAAAALAAIPETVARSGRASLDMIGEIAEANATLLAFLRSEGTAAVAHWQSLSGAKTPADILRIQVDEMQRVADASLTCFSALARRAGRLASGIGRV
jgi:hypothetical protein